MGSKGKGLVFAAAQRGDAEEITRLAGEGGQDINEEFDEDGSTALLVASQAGHTAAVEALLKAGADIDRDADDCATPLYVASMNGHLGVVELLCNYGASLNKRRAAKETPIYIASLRGHADVVQFLCERGANQDLPQKDGATPLLVAVEQGHVKVVRCLLEHRADTQLASNRGETPLSAAMADACGFPELQEMLVAAGATKVAHNRSHDCTVFCVLLLSVGCCFFWAYVIHLAHTVGWWDTPVDQLHHDLSEL